jgi:hypothetical protein
MTSEPCANGGCTKAHCCERETLEVARQERAGRFAAQHRDYVQEQSMESFRKRLRGKPKISN